MRRLLAQTCAPSAPAIANGDSAQRTLAVLAAEDNAVNAAVLKAMLDKLGHRAQFCKDGAVALAAFEKNRFDVVLLDYQMPVMDGLEACARMRALERAHQRPPTPIIALTAHAFEEQRQRCLAAGMDGYLSKPITMATLKNALAPYAQTAPLS